ncbi:MAG: type II toxin-antitoxin system HicA family toxin [Candidatus Thermoplasmatota archaeon]
MKVPSLDYDKVLKALARDGWVIVRQRGGHVRLQKQTGDKVQKLTVPAHKPLKRSTLAHLFKTAGITADRLQELL